MCNIIKSSCVVVNFVAHRYRYVFSTLTHVITLLSDVSLARRFLIKFFLILQNDPSFFMPQVPNFVPSSLPMLSRLIKVEIFLLLPVISFV